MTVRHEFRSIPSVCINVGHRAVFRAISNPGHWYADADFKTEVIWLPDHSDPRFEVRMVRYFPDVIKKG